MNDLAEIVDKKWRSHSRRLVIDIDALVCLTGHSSTVLARELPELTSRGRELQIARVVPACPRCTDRHRGGRVMFYPLDHQRVCLRHNVWLSPSGPVDPQGWKRDRRRLDISKVPVIRSAQQSHYRLARSYGRIETSAAYEIADDMWSRCFGYGKLWACHAERLVALGRDEEHFHSDDPAVKAVRYPETITIAGVLTSHYWQTVAARPEDEDTICAEIRRRVSVAKELDDTRTIWVYPSRGSRLRRWLDELQSEPSARAAYHDRLMRRQRLMSWT